MIWIVDDFYPNPDEIRNRALMLDYTRGKSTNKLGLLTYCTLAIETTPSGSSGGRIEYTYAIVGKTSQEYKCLILKV